MGKRFVTLRVVGVGSIALGLVRLLPLVLFLLYKAAENEARENLLQGLYWVLQGGLVLAGVWILRLKRWALFVGFFLVTADLLYQLMRGLGVDALDFLLLVGFSVGLYQSRSSLMEDEEHRGSARPARINRA